MIAELEYYQNVVDYPSPIRWHLRMVEGNEAYYICATAQFHGMRNEDCSTPRFRREKISEEALDFMHHFAQVFCLGYRAGVKQ